MLVQHPILRLPLLRHPQPQRHQALLVFAGMALIRWQDIIQVRAQATRASIIGSDLNA